MFRQLGFAYFFIIIGYIHCDTQESPCIENSSLDVCGTLCEPSCIDPKPEFCITIACDNGTRGCRCDSGFLRDPDTGSCVPPFRCSRCPPGQALLACGTICEGTCQAPYEPKLCRYIRCLLPGCGCDLNNSMVRDNNTDTCIEISQCS